MVRLDSSATKGRSQSVAPGSSSGAAAASVQIDSKTGRPAGVPTPLRGDILKFSMEGFAAEYFRSQKKATSKKAIPMEQELSWQKEPIKKSLLAGGFECKQ